MLIIYTIKKNTCKIINFKGTLLSSYQYIKVYKFFKFQMSTKVKNLALINYSGSHLCNFLIVHI